MSIVVAGLSKTYDTHVVVNDVSFEVADRECFVLLGPSGSGKSTVLRIVAGLIHADAGRVLLHGKDVSALPPQSRGVGMVFQQYALFGHMTVADNIEFSLRVRHVRREEREQRRDELLELVGLVGFQNRFPHELSGGQQQRVALARALAHRPEVLLLDEPFGALDARIRSELRRTLRRIQREVKVTTIFVTHDQDEAFELADRMAVMNFGRLLEVGPPRELYLGPQTEFVATFLGKANLFVGERSAEEVRLGDVRFPLPDPGPPQNGSRRVQVLFRPEDVAIKLTRDALDWPAFGEGVVEETEFSGSVERLRIRIPTIKGVRVIAPAVPFGTDHVVIDSTRSQHVARRYPLEIGDRAWVGIRRIHALAHAGLSFGIVDRGAPQERHALRWSEALARACQARVTLLTMGPDGTGVRGDLGAGLAALETRTIDRQDGALTREFELRPQDVVFVPRTALGAVTSLDELLCSGEHHILLVPDRVAPPTRVLICATAGESGKQDVVVAGRILRHLGVSATVLTALHEDTPAGRDQIARFHEASLRTLSLWGIEGATALRRGPVAEAIVGEIRRGPYDLLVLGSPVRTPGGPAIRLGLVTQVLDEVSVPTLIVRPALGGK